MENISIQRATNYIADWYVASVPAKDPAKPYLDEHNEAHRNIEMDRVSYNLQAGAFNLATIGLVTTIALAVIGTISLQMGFILAGLFLLIQHDVKNTLVDYMAPSGERNRDKDFQFAKAMGIVFNIPEVGKLIMKNIGFTPEVNENQGQTDIEVHPSVEQWEPIAARALGHIAWFNLLPSHSIVTDQQYALGERMAATAERRASFDLRQNDEHFYAWARSGEKAEG